MHVNRKYTTKVTLALKSFITRKKNNNNNEALKMLNVSHIDNLIYQIMKLTLASKRKQKWGAFSFFNFGRRKNFVVFFLVEEYFFSLFEMADRDTQVQGKRGQTNEPLYISFVDEEVYRRGKRHGCIASQTPKRKRKMTITYIGKRQLNVSQYIKTLHLLRFFFLKIFLN